MNEITMLEKLKVVFEITKSNIFYPIIILFLVFISFLFVTTNKNNSKDSKKAYSILYLIAIIITLVKYESSLSKMFDYTMNNLFVVFYFPNIAVYLTAIIITNIIMWISMFSAKTKTAIKVINSIIFSLMHYLFAIILNIITTKNINVFSIKQIYTNNDLHALIELSSNIFLMWIVFLAIYKVVMYYLESKKAEKVYESSTLTVEHIGKEENKKQININLPAYAKEIEAPYIVKREMSKTKIVYEVPKQLENTAVYEQMLTLDDYKLLVSLLKEEKSKKQKEAILEECETINQTKEEKQGQPPIENKSENRLSELMELYRSVN